MQPEPEPLQCAHCKGWFPIQFFSRDRARKGRGGRSKYCRKCDSDKFKRWYEENRARVIARVRRNKAKVQVVDVAGTQHDLTSRIDGKSPLRIFYELMEPKDTEEDNAQDQP